jgi:Mg-chelatase subunit ChlD
VKTAAEGIDFPQSVPFLEVPVKKALRSVVAAVAAVAILALLFSCAGLKPSAASAGPKRPSESAELDKPAAKSGEASSAAGKDGDTGSAVKPVTAAEPAAPAGSPSDGKSKSSGFRSSESADDKDGLFLEEREIGDIASAKPKKEAVAADSAASSGSKSSSGAATPSSVSGKKGAPAESGLKAGFSDDNEQFNYYLKFLEDYGQGVDNYPLRIGERIVLKAVDADGKPLNGAAVKVSAGGKQVAAGRTYADGTFVLYPLEIPNAKSYDVEAAHAAGSARLTVDRAGPRALTLKLAGKRVLPARTPLDILFVIDTTGSMSEEIQRLRDTIEIINANVSAVSPKPLVRFGMILYRDKDDAYVTKAVPLTDDLDAFQEALGWVEADGGGDTPEDLQSALGDAVKKVKWNPDGIRLAFVVTDAPPHLDYGQSYTYADAARDAKSMAVKFHTVGTGGLDIDGEYVLRQVSQYTQGRYIFLTYGEKGESSGGAVASVSHHTGSNYQTDKLEAIIIRFTREELALQSDVPVETPDDFFDARKIAGEDRDETLGKLFGQALRSLADYSTLRVGEGTKAAIAPLGFSEADKGSLSAQAEYFSESVLLSASRSKIFTLVERKDLQKILEEQELQYSALADEGTAAKLGSLIGADVMVTGQVYAKGGAYEIFFKLVRVESGEVLSVAKAKIAKELGL